MKTYAIRNARTKTTGHIRQDGTRLTYCNKPVGAPNGDFMGLKGWKMCTRCVKAEAADRAEATATATAALDPATAGTLPALVCVSHGTACTGNPKRRHIYRPAATATDAAAVASADRYISREFPAVAELLNLPPAPTAADHAAADTEARQAAELVTEAEATDGTWRGQWIGDTTALFDRPVEQGALFA